MATKTSTKAKTAKTKTAKPKTAKSPAKKRVTTVDLEKRIAELENQKNDALTKYGSMLEATSNMQLKLDAMLGQMLKALFIVGIGPDELMAKCQQMFRKNVVAD